MMHQHVVVKDIAGSCLYDEGTRLRLDLFPNWDNTLKHVILYPWYCLQKKDKELMLALLPLLLL